MSTETKNRIENEQKNCPFCGGRPYLEHHFRAFVNGQSTLVTFIRCRECNARTQRFSAEEYSTHDAIAKACEMWNRRAS